MIQCVKHQSIYKYYKEYPKPTFFSIKKHIHHMTQFVLTLKRMLVIWLKSENRCNVQCYIATYLSSPWTPLWTGSPAAVAAVGSPHPPPGSQTPCYMAHNPADCQTPLDRTHLHLYLHIPGEGGFVLSIKQGISYQQDFR